MPIALFKDTTYNLSGLIENIRRGEIALPEMQRPFVWQSAKVRELFDSMYRGFPVGYLLFWATGAEVGARRIGTAAKEAVPRLLIVDGQQRLTSLFAVVTGEKVVRKDFTEGRIRVAFRPKDQRFEVTDAAIEKDPEFIPDITELWKSYRETTKRFYARLAEHRGEPLTDPEEEKLEVAIDRLRDLQHYPFKAVELDASVDEEEVAQVFVRINSQGVTLKQADFILTLMTVFWEDGRRQLEAFSRAATVPSKGEPSPFNHFIEPAPDQMLRAAIGLAFRRGRLTHVYSILRGKDLETGQMDPARRPQQFAILEQAQDFALNLTNWHEFLKCVARAGFRSSRMITSENALLYTYVLWLIGRRDYRVELPALREVIARWFFMAQTTGRYTTSPESQIESDLLRLRAVADGNAAAFCEHLDREIGAVFTSDYWTNSLQNRLQTSSGRSPALVAYWAALNLLDAELLFSTTKVVTRLDPGVAAVRDVERHHLFPKHHLESLAIRGAARTNQIANMAFIDWSDNNEISADAPSDYWPVMSARVDSERLKRQRFWHALPIGWEQLGYDEFLEKRRRLIAEVIHEGFKKLLSAPVADVKALSRTTEDLIKDGESINVEFKSTARWNLKAKTKDPRLEHVIVKTVAAFMNNEGGTLLIGVADSGEVLGLNDDYRTVSKGNRDGYELFLGDLFKTCLNGSASTLVRTSFSTVNGQDVCRLDVAASGRPVFARSPEVKEHGEFWVRIGNSTRQLVGSDMIQYQDEHWG